MNWKKWLRAVFLFPFSILMGIPGEGLNLTIDDEAGDPVAGTGDDGEEIEIEDRGDNLDDEFIEVDEDIVAGIAAADDKDDRFIPKSRFDEVNNEKKELKSRLEALEAQVAAGTVPAAAAPAAAAVEEVPAFDFDGKENEYLEAITEGDIEKAKTIRSEIRQAERAALKEEFRTETAQTNAQHTVAERKAAVIDQAFLDYPELKNGSETYNPDMVAKVNRMALAYQTEGKTADVALSLAIKDLMPPIAAAAETVVPDKGDKEARERNARAAAAQAPKIGAVGTGERAQAASVNVEEMTEAEFEALPEREKKRLRGD